MKNTLKLVLCIVFLAVIVLMFIFREHERKEQFEVFNTGCGVTVWGVKTDEWDDAFRELIQELQRLHNTINVYDKESELSRLNATAYETPFKCSDMLWDILAAARDAYYETDGAFDATIGPLMALWGFHYKRDSIPTQPEIDDVLKKIGIVKVVFDDTAHTVFFPIRGMRLDLGGIAKGYACDIAAAILLKHGIRKYMIDLGGNIMLSKELPRGIDAFNVGIRNPADKSNVIETLHLRGCAVATSGNYERARIIDGKKVGHIMDPRTGRPGEFFSSVTAVTSRGVDSDIYSTAAFVGGHELADKLISNKPDTKIYFK